MRGEVPVPAEAVTEVHREHLDHAERRLQQALCDGVEGCAVCFRAFHA